MFIVIVFGYVLFLGLVVVFVMVRLYGVLNEILFGFMLLFSGIVDFVLYISLLGNLLIYVYYNVDFCKEFLCICCRRNC